ncbi:MAG: hypothetical protein RMY28_036400 [Nostoc sp. ChiSLP01]|nr:hypothetical protein [Nostoc sp. CmiSLP01]MDZ8286362.1 hypothetical protein [Nostoc sp. ChiSLP01]
MPSALRIILTAEEDRTLLELSCADKVPKRTKLRAIASEKGLINWQGYDSKEQCSKLRKRGIRPQIPKINWKTKNNIGRPIKFSAPRFQQEHCFAWYQSKYRRLVVRWERRKVYFDRFINLATIHIWIQRILLVG